MLERVGLPFQFPPPHFLPEIALGSGRAERFNKPIYPRCQRFYRLFVDLCLLGEL